MARPSGGYRNSAGQVIPGVTDIPERFCPKDALIGWAYNRGKAGLPRSTRGDLDIGEVTHMMAAMDMRGQSMDQIDEYLDNTATLMKMPYEAKATCVRCFAAYRNWRTSFSIRPMIQEQSMISERYQYGGTPDLIGLTAKGPALVDLKTSAKGEPYYSHPIQLAAYGQLWRENGGDTLAGGYHLLMLPKDGSPFRVISYSEAAIQPYWQIFEAWRAIYDLDQACQKAEALEGIKIVPNDIILPHPAKPARKAPERLSYSPPPPMTMGELLRSYGHVRANA